MKSETIYVLNNDISGLFNVVELKHLLSCLKADVSNISFENDSLKHDLVSHTEAIKQLKSEITVISEKNKLNNLFILDIKSRKLSLKERIFGKINI